MNDSASSLLTNSLERFQVVKIGDVQVVVSVDDTLPLGVGSEFGSDHTSSDIRLFAESVVLRGTLACKSAIVSVNSLTPGTDAELSTSGAAGKPVTTQNHDSKNTGKRGDDGKPAGELSVYIENATGDAPGFALSAKGGAGSAGEEGVKAPGGNGGNGGKGGNVTLIAGIPAERYLTDLAQIVKLKTLEEKQRAVGQLRVRIKNDKDIPQEWKSPIDGALQQAEGAGKDHIDGQINKAILAISKTSSPYATNAYAAIYIGGGAYGSYGVGSPSGSSGSKGSDGTQKVITFGVPEDLIDPEDPAPSLFLVHPSQCARLLEIIRLRYLTLNPVHNAQGVRDLAILLTRLEARTRLFAKVEDNSPLVHYYAEHEGSMGAVGSVRRLRAINTQCNSLLTQLKSGLDLYGYNPHWVPMGSFEFYSSLLDQMISNFSVIEKSNNSYFDGLKQNSKSLKSIKEARQQSDSARIKAKAEVDLILKSLPVIGHNIAVYETELPSLKEDLRKKIDRFAEKVKTKFNIDVEQLLSALSMVAFAPQSKFMMMTQLADVAYHNINSLATDAGVNVNRSYLVNEIKAIGSSIDSLKEGYHSLDNGLLQPDDPQAGKLIVEEKSFRETFDTLKNTFSEVKDVEDAFSVYIEKILDRNTQILLYNANVILAAGDLQDIKDAEKRIAELNDNALDAMQPDLPDLVSFVSQLYYRSREQIMRTLDLTARAYRMWALSDRDLIAETFAQVTVAKIDETALRVARNSILFALEGAVQNFGTNSARFPANAKGKGIIVEIGKDQVASFRRNGIISIRPTTVKVTTGRDTSPFAGMANVRVTRVRVWMKGAKTADDRLQIRIRHIGEEDIVSADGEVFGFVHESINKTFIYHPSNESVLEEASFESEYGHDRYAMVGPFASWHIEVLESDNKDLDLSKVTEVSVEFHGTNYTFKS
ncbi:hypothetical protein AB0C51_14770 [Streptomyces pathocidini]|uniref:hypothetical protein n=1 Tax=Streptomyces pathocidini TaxID=1650571 RepID=UPI0033EF059A